MTNPLVVLLAGGQGTRFVPFVTNKTIWPFLAKPYLFYTLDSLAIAGVEEVLVIANTHNQKVISTYVNQSLKIRSIVQPEALGMDDALKSATVEISGRSIVVINGVDLVEPSLFQDFFKYIGENQPRLLSAGFEMKELLPLGYYKIENGKVTATVEKPTQEEKPSDIARLVCDYFQDPDEFISLFDNYTNTDQKDARYEQAQTILLSKYGSDLITYTGKWNKLKYPFHVLDVMSRLLSEQKRTIPSTAQIHPTAIIDGDVVIHPTAKIEAHAVIKGPAYIGKDVVIGNLCLVRQSTIEEGTTVGFGSEVARSYVGPRCNLHHTFVGDSVLESEVNMSWGTVTANLRLDKKTVRITLPSGQVVDSLKEKLGALIAKGSFLGVQVSTMPGTLLAAGTKISPATVVPPQKSA
ncbi:MAG: sugar phosphate nucleotidyltransferase [bacterium]